MANTDPPAMHVKIYSPFKIYFDGQANSLSAINKTGPFDILPRHKNFMSLLAPCVVTVRAAGKDDFKLNITRGVMHVKSDKTTIFLDV
jgi:F0F1-type ATP synthase epsilon subunit